MPVHKVPGGWAWGEGHGVFKTKKEARAQEKAIYSSGWKEKRNKRKEQKK